MYLTLEIRCYMRDSYFLCSTCSSGSVRVCDDLCRRVSSRPVLRTTQQHHRDSTGRVQVRHSVETTRGVPSRESG